MGFTELSDLDAQTTISLGGYNKKAKKENPTSQEGYYLGTKSVTSAKSPTGKSNLHILQTAKGNVGVWGKTDMDRKMNQVTPGTMIRIEHVGEQNLPNGNTMHKYKVLVDADNIINVPKFANVQSTAMIADTEGDDDPVVPAFDAEESFDESAAAAARKAKVQALLNKNKK